MNIFQILSELEKVDPEVYERFDSRRRVFKHMTGLGKNIAATAVPLAFTAIFNKAYGQTSGAPSATDVLRFALRLEYLESYFYDMGLGQAGTTATAAQTTLRGKFSSQNLAALDKIRTDEANHVKLLSGALGSNTVAAPARTGVFDFTGGKGTNAGPFATVFTDAAIFLAVAQSLEDTGVRAYKGGAPYLMSADKTPSSVLETALNIHSVEARHAARLRTMRRAAATSTNPSSAAPGSNPSSSPKSWISGQDNGGASPMQTAPIYGAGTAPSYTPSSITFPAEDNVTQGGVNLQTALASLNFPASAFSEAFDEPLPVPTVLSIASTFTVTGSTFFS